MFCGSVLAQNITVSGHFYEQGSLESLPGGLVYEPVSQKAATTNTYGFYTLTLPYRDSMYVVFNCFGHSGHLGPPWASAPGGRPGSQDPRTALQGATGCDRAGHGAVQAASQVCSWGPQAWGVLERQGQGRAAWSSPGPRGVRGPRGR